MPGNSGSPIILLPTGKVIGIASYMKVKKIGAREEQVRRFGYRLDSVQQWQKIDWNRFYAEADAMNGIERTTHDLIHLFSELNFDKISVTVRSKNDLLDLRVPVIQLAFHGVKCETPAIQTALGIFNRSPGNLQDLRTLQSALDMASVNDIRQAETQLTYDYFKQRLADEKRNRDEITNLLNKALKVF